MWKVLLKNLNQILKLLKLRLLIAQQIRKRKVPIRLIIVKKIVKIVKCSKK